MTSPESGDGELIAPHPSEPFYQRPHIRQLAVQFAAVIAVLSLAWPYYGVRDEVLPWPETAFVIGGCAFLLAALTHQPWWWRLIHLAFAPLAWLVAQWQIDPGWFLLAFGLLLLVYRGALNGQVPLYLSNAQTAAALVAALPDRPDFRFLDIGAGLGSVLAPLAKARPDGKFTGIENAPATWLAGRLRTAGLANCDWHWGDMWQIDLAAYDVVYAFLSPVPMPALWLKARAEMRPGSLFVSNTFAIPDVAPETVIEVEDGRQTRLYCYRVV